MIVPNGHEIIVENLSVVFHESINLTLSLNLTLTLTLPVPTRTFPMD